MGWRAWILGLVGAATAAGCVHAPNPQDQNDPTRRPAYVEAARAPSSVGRNARVEVTVEGSLPDPLWEITEVEVTRDGRRIRITPWIARKGDGPAMQMLVPFTRAVPLEGLAPGTWTVEVVGHGGVVQTVEIAVGES